MRKINHIILDFENQPINLTPNYWVLSFVKKEKSLKLLSSNSIVLSKLSKSTTFLNYININFLRKEFLYTKLKYSRSPAYDIVSGGAAVIFAGFLGFLVSEKFGLELVDSGDFYFFGMYLVFISFSVRPLLVTLTPSTSFWNILSFKPLLNFYINLLLLFWRK
jgi:hypothetical protein